MNFEHRTLNVELRIAMPVTDWLGHIGSSKLDVGRSTFIRTNKMGSKTVEPKPWRAWMMGHRFTVFLCALVLLVVAVPVANAVFSRSPRLFS